MRTLDEIKEKLKQLDQTDLLELLQISSEELIDRFEDKVEENVDKLDRELNQWFLEEPFGDSD